MNELNFKAVFLKLSLIILLYTNIWILYSVYDISFPEHSFFKNRAYMLIGNNWVLHHSCSFLYYNTASLEIILTPAKFTCQGLFLVNSIDVLWKQPFLLKIKTFLLNY